MTQDGSLSGVPFDEWTTQLTMLISNPPPGSDLAELTGTLGRAYLERYDIDPDENLLHAAVAQFERALAHAPTHEQAVIWHWGLGVAHAERARLGPGLTDHERAVAQLTVAHQGWPPDDPEGDIVAVTLLDAIWERFLERCLDESRTVRAAAADADETLTAMLAVQVSPADPDNASYGRMLLGMALLARYDYAGERDEDLTAGIATLTAALAELSPRSTPRYAVASADLAAACLEAAGRRKDRASVELALTVGERAISASAPAQPGWRRLHRGQATAHTALWDLDEDPVHLARAIACWRTVREDDDDPAVPVTLAELLHSRAVRTGDPEGVPEAVALLEEALPLADQPGPVWRQLGETHLLHWQLAHVPGSLDAATRCLDHAIAAANADDELLAAHAVRVVVADEVMEHDVAQDDSRVPPSLGQLRGAIDEAGRALDAAVTATARERAVLATVLVYAEFARFAEAMDQVDAARLRHLLALGRAVGDDAPAGLVGALELAEGMLEYEGGPAAASPDSDGLVGALLRARKDPAFARVAGDRLRASLPLALHSRASGNADLRDHTAAGAWATQLATEFGDEGHTGNVVAQSQLLSVVMEAVRRGGQGDLTGMHEASERALALWQRFPSSRQDAQALGPLIRLCQDLVAIRTGEARIPAQPPVPLPAGPLSYLTVTATIAAATTQVAAAVRDGNLPLLRQWADHLTDFTGRLEPGHVIRVAALTLIGKAELTRARGLGDRAAAARAARQFEVATAEVAGPESLLWTDLVRDHAEALRRAGDPDRARTRRLGLAALHGHARRVLLQAGTDHAMETAREAAADATTVARWCLQDQADDDLVTALDAGRGLVLHAATVSRTVADLLTQAGQPELAEEWRQTAGLGRDRLTGEALGADLSAGELPDDLRTRVLRALETAGLTTQGPLAQVRAGEVRQALAALSVDALVYLVPAADPVPGLAVVVPAVGEIDVMELPELVVGGGSPVHRLLHAAQRRNVTGREAGAEPRDAGAVGGGAPDSVGARIDDLCRWAWRAAMGRIVADLRSIRLSPARLVLVPMGVLGLVPWHAAYQDTPSGRHYAVHDLVVSYSPSARMLCAAAARPARPVRSALVIGDPLGDLPFAGVEARAIHQRFYPDGQYLGPDADADADADADPGRVATPESVLEWIRSAGAGPSLLHLACHGRVDPARPADAHVVLVGGRLPARQLLEESRLAALDLDQVFLAACTTNLAGTDHDEAFSLATAFLAAGAHTVYGSLWSVPDVGTSLLMYLVHHFLRAEGCAPAEALHRAQLWMLDPARKHPADMPVELVAQCGRGEIAEPLAWAAFTHLGR
ncbi:CHAT domain-containing protein [Micromonospora sp. NPDC048999]|uniref:CHAT domain-containing protein n=1 Tax=Micromonospora sp. NPDC048999 TaxID=3155391 RepID=UPI0033CE3979